MQMIGIDVGGTRHQGRRRRDDDGRAHDAARPRRDAAPLDAEGGRQGDGRADRGLPPELSAGVGFPAVILGGVVKTAANIDSSWIGTPADHLFADALARPLDRRQRRRRGGPRGDALRRGARRAGDGAHADARHRDRIGALPRRRPAPEHRARAPAAARQGRRATRRRLDQGEARGSAGTTGARCCRSTSTSIDALLWPDLIIIGGGISKDADHFIDELPARVRCVPAAMQNRAGIVGRRDARGRGRAPHARRAFGRGPALDGPHGAGAAARAGARRQRLPADRAPRR